MAAWTRHPIVVRAKPYLRMLRDRPGRVLGLALRIGRNLRRRVARARHRSIPILDLRPADVREANLHLVLARLERAGVPVSVIRGRRPTRTVIAVAAEHRERTARALAVGNSAPHLRVQMLRQSQVDQSPSAARSTSLASLADAALPSDLAVLRVFAWHDSTPDTLVYGPQYACDVEFWPAQRETGDDAASDTGDDAATGDRAATLTRTRTRSRTRTDRWRIAPRVNGLASHLAPDLFAPVPVPMGDHMIPMARGVHGRATLDDITFPIDAVYLWVDVTDPEWQRRRREAIGDAAPGVESPGIDATVSSGPSIEELRYSLRSLDMFAPWIRRVYVVTDGQRPPYLVPDDRLVFVDHRDIVDRPDRLPVFDSEPLVTWIHRIEGLAEHFIYLNDDLFFGRDVMPDTFFTPAGQVRVFTSSGLRPFGPVMPVDSLPEIKAKRVADLIEAETGRRPVHAVRHTTHPLTVSLMRQMESTFADAIEITRRQRMRSADGVPIELLVHHVSQITGDGVRSSIDYGYVNVTTAGGMADLRRAVMSRRDEVICVNDTPTPTAAPEPVPVDEVRTLLDRYFPVRSRWER